MLISFCNQKGGCGKSTISVLAANTLSQKPFGHSVLVIDLDEQKSIVQSRAIDMQDYDTAPPYDILDLDYDSFLKQIIDLDKKYDLIIIDMAGRMGKDIETVLVYVDVCIIPITSGNYSLESSLSFMQYVHKLSQLRENKLIARCMLNKYQRSRANSKFLKVSIPDIESMYKIPFMSSRLRDYTTYQNIDTFKSLYKENAKDATGINYKKWFDEFYNLLG